MNTSEFTYCIKTVGILGTGALGTAMALLASYNAEKVLCYTREEAIAAAMNKYKINSKYFPQIKLPDNVYATTEITELSNTDLICITVPAQQVRSTLLLLTSSFTHSVPLLICAKGIESHSCKLMSQVVDEIASYTRISIFSGPNFASEIMAKKFSAANIACTNKQLGSSLYKLFASEQFVPYISKDIIGTQVCGAFKNVIAIATGIVNGLNLGENTQALLITMGLAEMQLCIQSMGGDTSTAMGLAGIGDLMLTCNSMQSRNTRFGYEIAVNNYIPTLHNKTIEGYHSAQSFYTLMHSLGMELPITTLVYKILQSKVPPSHITYHLRNTARHK